eukprot:6890209-Pyramimonas_sp.AAC.1
MDLVVGRPAARAPSTGMQAAGTSGHGVLNPPLEPLPTDCCEGRSFGLCFGPRLGSPVFSGREVWHSADRATRAAHCAPRREALYGKGASVLRLPGGPRCHSSCCCRGCRRRC